jgi:photosystem II stability/assembly factor-like uncharacterized protein
MPQGFGPQTLAIDLRDPDTLYASSLGVFKSVDGAQTWTPIYQPPTGFPALVVDPHSPGVIFCAGSGIIRSTDGGSNWTPLTSGLHAIQVSAIAIDPQNSGALYAASNEMPGASTSAAYKTSNYGGTWKALTSVPWYLTNALAVDPIDSSVIYAGTDTGVFKSVDGGDNWTPMSAGLAPPHQATGVSFLIIDPQKTGTIYAASPDRHWLFKSIDGAATWSTINSGLPLAEGFPAFITALAMDSGNTSVLYAGFYVGSPSVFMTKDGGLTWTAASPDFGSGDGKCCAWISSLAADPRRSGAVYAAISTNSSGGAIWRTTDAGATWQNLFASPSSVTALAIHPRDPSRIYAASTNGIMASADAGVSWRPVRGTPTLISFLGFDPQNPATLYAAGVSGLFALDVGQESRTPFR